MGLLDKFKKGDNLSPEKEDAISEIQVLIQVKEYEKALELHEKIFDQDHAEDWYSKGNLLGNLEKYQKASACYLKAIDMDENYIKAWYRLSQIYFAVGKYELARLGFSKVCTVENDAKDFQWYNASLLYIMLCWYNTYQSSRKGLDQLENLIQVTNKIVDVGLVGNEYVRYCFDNLSEILHKLEPKTVAEFRA